MIRHRLPIATLLFFAAILTAPIAQGAGSIFTPARFSHDPSTGKPAIQYERKAPAYKTEDPTYRRSGYVIHRKDTIGPNGTRSTYQVHETWGEPFGYGYQGYYGDGYCDHAGRAYGHGRSRIGPRPHGPPVPARGIWR